MKFGHKLNHLGCHFFRGKITWIYLPPTHNRMQSSPPGFFFPFLVGNPFNQIAPWPQTSDLFLMVTVIGGFGAWWFGFLGSLKMKAGIFWILRGYPDSNPKPPIHPQTANSPLLQLNHCVVWHSFPNGFSHQKHTKPEDAACWFTVISRIVIYPAGNYITYPTSGKGKSSSKVPFFWGGDMLVSGNVPTVDGSGIRQSNHLECIKPVGSNGRYLPYHLSNEKTLVV